MLPHLTHTHMHLSRKYPYTLPQIRYSVNPHHLSQQAVQVQKKKYGPQNMGLYMKTAFLHGYLDEQIYMQQPEGFKEPNKEEYVCLLKKSLYGLKQSPKQWYKRFDLFMVSHGYTHCEYDRCIYYRVLVKGSYVLLALYVDDMLVATKDKEEELPRRFLGLKFTVIEGHVS